MPEPRLKTVQKVPPPYPLNKFPKAFAEKVGSEIAALLAMGARDLEGETWESVFATAIDAEWHPSNVGLDDIVKGSFAWGAKTVKRSNPHRTGNIRLIAGRNSPDYSFDAIAETDDGIGSQVLDIWNARVESLRDRFKELRSVVLMKPSTMLAEELPFSVFEFETIRYSPDNYYWRRNPNNNLVGYDRRTDEHKFTWQRHGSQFTIVETVPEDSLKFFLKRPEILTGQKLRELIGYDESWVRVVD